MDNSKFDAKVEVGIDAGHDFGIRLVQLTHVLGENGG